MKKGIASLPSMPSPPIETEGFLAALLWTQKGTCECPACECLREMGTKMMDKHIKKGT